MKQFVVSTLLALSCTCYLSEAAAIERVKFWTHSKDLSPPQERHQGTIQEKKAETAEKGRKGNEDKNTVVSGISNEDKTTVVVKNPQGLLLVGSPVFKQGIINKKGVTCVQGLEICNLEIPGDADHLKAELNRLYFKKESITPHDIYLIKRAIISHWNKNHQPVVHVYLPEQKIVNGTLQLLVADPVIGEIRYKGHQHFAQENISQHVKLKKGDKLRTDLLSEDLKMINHNYFRQTNALFVPGSDMGTTDIEFVTEDRHTWRPYIGIDNSGYSTTGYNRFYAGVNVGNLFGADHLFDYQFTCASDPHKFMAHTAKYVLPTPWRHWVMIYGGISLSHLNTVDDKGKIVNNSGRNYQASLRYEIPLRSYSAFLHEFTIGYDFKHTNNDLLLGGSTKMSSSGSTISQLMAGYNAGWKSDRQKLSLCLEAFLSPGETLPDMEKSRFEELRYGASPEYAYGRFTFTQTLLLPANFDWRFTLRAQLASATLLPTEQQGVGGYDTVRGYLEREVSGDNALIANAEIRTPAVSLLSALGKQNMGDSFQLLGFLDVGFINNYTSSELEPKTSTLIGIGPGLRYHIGSHLVARADFGKQLRKTGLNHHFSNRLHFGIVASY